MAEPESPAALLQSLKRAGADSPAFRVPVRADVWLRALRTSEARPDDREVHALTDGRNASPSSFLTEFVATPQRTAGWLRDVVTPNPGKLLFVVETTGDRILGYMGLDFMDWQERSGEVDAIVRVEDGERGAMSAALATMIEWARSQLGLECVEVRVRSDNPALSFYERLGFVEIERVGLRSELAEDGAMVVWSADAGLRDATVELVTLRYPDP